MNFSDTFMRGIIISIIIVIGFLSITLSYVWSSDIESATPEITPVVAPVDLKTVQPSPLLAENIKLKNEIYNLRTVINQIALAILGVFADGKITNEEIQGLYTIAVQIYEKY